ncbi:MAG: DegV family protein [Chloroflexota bacterium]
MQRVRIVTDSVAQLTQEMASRHGVKVVPAATILCDGKTYVDGVDISPAEAYRLLEQDPTQFTTSAIPPAYFYKAFEEVGRGAREILCITVSSKLSGVYNSALLAGEQVRERVPGLQPRVFDSMSAAGGEGLVVLAAAGAAARGLDLDGVTAVAERARRESECLFVFDTLRHTYRTGRVPRVVSEGADLLGVRPLCRIGRDGMVHVVGLARSRRKGVERMVGMVRERARGEPIHAVIMHTAAVAEAQGLKERMAREFDCRGIFVSEFSPVMGYATGPGVLGIAFRPESGD